MAESQTPVPVRRILEGIDSRAWEHPADRGALAALRILPGFDEVLKKLIGFFGERGTRLAFQADSVRVSERQFPRLHGLWQVAQNTLDAPDRYDLYISQSPFVNAGAYGVDKPWVVIRSGSLRLLDDDEIVSIMGHELGHVLSGHALYHTMMAILINLAASGFPVVGMAALPILLALKEWYRKSELSSDRAGLLAVQRPAASMGAFMRLAGGGTPEEMNLNEFLAQAEEYRKGEGVIDQVLKVMNTLQATHPFLVLRAAMLRDWIEEGGYDRILRGEYPLRTDPRPSLASELGAGMRHYTGGAQEAAEKAGDAMRRMRDAFDRGYKGTNGDGGNGSSGGGSGPGGRTD